MVYGYTAELAEAQDIAQEAFCRAWQRWHYVSGYDNPAAWVRRVATNLAHSRWKRARRAAAHLMRQRAHETPPVDPEHVAVVAALRKLPLPQQKALVLHHILDLPVDEVAEHLDAPVNTVKSWLHRGRSALASELRLDIREEITNPPVEAVVDKARRKRAMRRAGWAAVIIIVLVGAVAAAGLTQPKPQPAPITPTPTVSPSPSVSPSPTRAMPAAMTVKFTVTGSCPGIQRLTFLNGRTMVGTMRISLHAPRWIDVTGDGRDDLLVDTACHNDTLMGFPGRHAVLETQPDGTLREIGQLPGSLISMRAGVLHVDDASNSGWAPGRTALMTWNGNAFVRSGSGGYPPIKTLDLTDISSRLSCHNLVVPSTLRLTFDSNHHMLEGGRNWGIGELTQWITLRGNEYYLMDVICQPEGDDKPALSRHPLLLTWTGTGWRPVATVPVRNGSRYASAEIDGDRLTLFGIAAGDKAEFDWNGKDFIAR